MHTSQSRSHTFPCSGGNLTPQEITPHPGESTSPGFLNWNHGVKVDKGPSGFEDNRTSRLKSLFQEHPMPFPPTPSSSNSTMMPFYPWWQHQGRATRGWSWWSAAQVSDCPRHGVSREFEVWFKSGGIFLLHSAAEAACLFLITGPRQCRAVPKDSAHSKNWSESGIPMAKPSLIAPPSDQKNIKMR